MMLLLGPNALITKKKIWGGGGQWPFAEKRYSLLHSPKAVLILPLEKSLACQPGTLCIMKKNIQQLTNLTGINSSTTRTTTTTHLPLWNNIFRLLIMMAIWLGGGPDSRMPRKTFQFGDMDRKCGKPASQPASQKKKKTHAFRVCGRKKIQKRVFFVHTNFWKKNLADKKKNFF